MNVTATAKTVARSVRLSTTVSGVLKSVQFSKGIRPLFLLSQTLKKMGMIEMIRPSGTKMLVFALNFLGTRPHIFVSLPKPSESLS